MRGSRQRRRSSLLPLRPSEGRLVGGVCTALAEELTIDVTLVRLVFIVLALAWGLGFILYGVLWILMANADDRGGGERSARDRLGAIREELSLTGRRLSGAWSRGGAKGWPLPLDRRWIALGLMLAGIAILLASLGAFSWLTPTRAIGLAAVLAGASVFISLRSQ